MAEDRDFRPWENRDGAKKPTEVSGTGGQE